MQDEVKAYLEKYPEAIRELYVLLRTVAYESAAQEIEEKLWAKLPSYYAGDAFVRLIPFKDHINVEARAVDSCREQLTGYKITAKGMLQIYLKQPVPVDALRQIFAETLREKGAE